MGVPVLLVQNDPQAMQVLGRFFHERGDEVWQTADLNQANMLLERHQPVYLLLDIHFPGNDWLLFLKHCRQRFPQLKIILTNKYPDLQREILASENGVAVFLRQPFTRSWIEKALQRASESEADRIKAEAPRKLPRVRVPVRLKITVPYLALALVFALASAYVISQIVLQSVEDRFVNQLIASGRQTSDWMVREENRLLTTLRSLSNSQGMADAILKQDADTARSLALPVAANSNEEDIEILDLQASTLLSIRLKAGGGVGDYEYARGDTFLASQGFVRQTLLATSDSLGDKFSGEVNAPWGSLFFVAGPVYGPDGKLVGAVLVGKTLRSLARQAAQDAAAAVTFYNLDGQPLASTIYNDLESVPVEKGQISQVLALGAESSQTRNVSVTAVDYTEILAPWQARSSADLGLVGTALPQAFLVRTSSVTQVQIFLLVAAAILLVIGIGLYVASRITGPLVRLAMASSRVAQGNLDVKVDSQGDDEVAVLAHSFNYMVAGLQEGSVYRDLLGRTVSPEVREQLRQTFTSGNVRLEGQESVATVLMTDIRGFTSISEKTDPTSVLTWLNEYFGLLVPIVTANGGVVNKFDGDAMLAFFGILPKRLSPKQGALCACKTAQEILKAVNELNALRIERNEPPLVTGVGINTGVVIAGGLGSSDRLHYTIIGDTVNTAQRLESLTRQVFPTSGILLGQSTYMALAEHATEFQLQAAGSFAVKGKADQVQVFKLLPDEARVPEVML